MSSASSSRYSPATRTLDQLSVNEAQQQLEQFVKEIRTSSISSREGLDEVEKALLADFVAAASVTPTPPQPILEEVTPFILPPPSSLLSPQVMRQFRYDSYDEVMSMASPVGRLHHEESQKPRNASFATIASVQLEDNVFDCEWDSCTEAFRSLDDLCKHLQHDHLVKTQVPFHCMWRSCERHPHAATLSQGIKTSAIIDECTQTPFRPFPKRNKLVMHVRTHTGERPFKCEECGRGFARADGLASHRKRHEQRATARGHVRGASGDAAEALLNSPQCVIGGVGVWACRVCARRFTTLVAARRHEAQAHAETEALGGEVDELVGVIPVQDMLYGHGLQPMMAPHNPTPPVNNWYGGASAPGLDDSAWWAVAAERHFQSVVQGHKNPHASAKDQFLTPPSL